MPTNGDIMLNTAQRAALDAYGATVTNVQRIDTEPATPHLNLYPVRATLDTGWIVTVGQYGAVLAEERER